MCFSLKKQILSQLFRTIRYKTIVFGSISLAMTPAIERTGLLNGALATASHDINSRTKTAHRSVANQINVAAYGQLQAPDDGIR